MPNKKKPTARQAVQIRWKFDPDIPTYDYFESGSLDEMWNLQEAVYGFVVWLKEDHFLAWEAVVCDEQDIPLSAKQKKALASLLNFNDGEVDQILYIDGIARPSEPWHEILAKIVPHLLIEPFRTIDSQWDVKVDGWNQIATALREHGQELSLPTGVDSLETIVDAELQHKLWLQFCFDDLSGLGQDDDLTLEDPEEHYRIEWFIDHLREHKDSVAHFCLTLNSLLARVVLPAKDQPIFLKLMQDKLGLSSAEAQIVDRL